MKALDKRQRIILLGALGLIALVSIILLLPYLVPRKGDSKQESVVAVIPEADLTEGDESKTGSYRRSSRASNEYWSAQEEESEDASPEPSSTKKEDSRRPKPQDVESLFGDCREAPSESAPKQSRPAPPSKSETPKGASRPTEETHSQERSPEESPAPEPPRPAVKRSGAVSSLDEDVTTDLGNGFSTLDGTDRWVGAESGKAYRCMFTRDEKVRSGQRITVRLLEDLVVGGVHIPRNTHLQGVVSIADRMEVRISSLDIGGRILTLRFEAFDTDGGKGIYCSDLSAATKSATDQALSTASSTLNSRLGRIARDAATVGASIVRTKSGEATVSVPAGYTFYIIETAP